VLKGSKLDCLMNEGARAISNYALKCLPPPESGKRLRSIFMLKIET
jgi:hypothetical protein